MSVFSLSSTTNKKLDDRFSTRLLADFFLFCSFILSHPLYFSYLIFFSPCLFKLLSFLSPLFITTSLLLLALLTISPPLIIIENSHHQLLASDQSNNDIGFFLTTYQALVHCLLSRVEDDQTQDFRHFEELEAYKIVFETSNLDIGSVDVFESEVKEHCFSSSEAQVCKSLGHETSDADDGHDYSQAQLLNNNPNGNLVEDSVLITRPAEATQLIAEGKTLRGFLHQKERTEDLQELEKEVKALTVKYVNKVEEQSMRMASKEVVGQKIRKGKASDDDVDDSEEYYFSPGMDSHGQEANYSTHEVKANPQTSAGSNLGSFGSMRKEKEWRRTLACKLFEERHNVDGGEGMDLLWETYETDSVLKVEAKSNKSKKEKKGSKTGYYDDEEEEEENDGQLCCLQALKFSAGKMNLGMGRPNLVKISKALKGIGWLHRVSSRHSKKG